MIRFELAVFRLTQARLEQGLSARELSFRIHKNAGYISSIECRKITPSINSIFDICTELNMTPLGLFDLNTNTSTLHYIILNQISELNNEELQIILSVIIKFKNANKKQNNS